MPIMFSCVFFIIPSILCALLIAVISTYVIYHHMNFIKLGTSLNYWYVWTFNWIAGICGLIICWTYYFNDKKQWSEQIKEQRSSKKYLSQKYNE